MSDIFDLNGKVVAITGATRGIGKAMASALAEHGANIAFLSRDKNSEYNEIKQNYNVKTATIPCNLNDKKEVIAAIPEVVKIFGEIDILINCAGIQRRSQALDFKESDWDDVLNVNLKMLWLLSQQAGKFMVDQTYGKIINIASLNSFQGGINIPAYAAAKGGVAQLTKALSNEWAKHNVNVNAIVPGYIKTDMNEALIKDENRNKEILSRIPAGRWGTPNDFKGAVIFLASDASNYVNGHLLCVDGGWMGR